MSLKRKNVLIGILAAALVATLGLAAVGYTLYARVNAAGGLKAILQQALSDPQVGITSTIEETDLSFEFAAAPFRLKAKNIRLEAEDTALILPSSEFGFSLLNLISGKLVPSDMRMSGLEIEINHGEDGWHAGPSMALITSLMRENAENAANSDALSSIRDIFIGNAKLIIKRKPLDHHGGLGDEIVLSPIAISMQHNNNRINGLITIKDEIGGEVIINFSGDQTGSSIEFTSTLNKVNMKDIYPYLGVNMPEISALGNIYGRVALAVEDREITSLSGDLTTDAGQTILPGFGGVEFSNASILFDYDAVIDRLTVSNFDMTTKKTGSQISGQQKGDLSGQISFAGELRGLSKPAPMVTARLRGSRLGFDRLLGLLPKETVLPFGQDLSSTIQGGRVDALGIDLEGVMDRQHNHFEITGLDVVTDLRGIKFQAAMASVKNLEGSLGARLEFSMEKSGLITHAKADFLLRDASLVTTSSDRVVQLEGIELRTLLKGKTLTIQRGAIDAKSLGQLALVAKIDLEENLTPNRLDFSIKAEQIDKELFTELWPANIRPKSRQWIANRIKGGVINGLDANLGLDLVNELAPSEDAESNDHDEAKAAVKPVVIYLDGKANLSNTEITYLEGMPPIKSAFVPIRFQEGLLRADLETGVIEGIDISGSRLIIRQDEVGPMVDVAVLGNGDFGGALRLIDHPRLNLLKPAGINMTQSKGQMDASMSLKWHLPPQGKSIKDMGGMSVNVTASIAEAELRGLPGGFDLEQTDMEIILANQDLNMTGRGFLNQAPAVMTLRYRNKSDLSVNIGLEKSEAATAIINEKSGLDLGGRTSGLVQINKQANDPETRFNFDLDFGEASLNLDRFGLIKLPGEDAMFNAQIIIEDHKIKTIRYINLDSEFLSIKGDAQFDERGIFLGAFFDQVAWPGNDISQITIDRNAEDVLRISAEAKIIDLTPLRREDSPGEGMSLVVDLTANRIVLDEKVSLSGNVNLKTEKDGLGEAEFLGSLYLSGKPFMTESTLKSIFGGGQGDLLEGRGLIGGAEASISLSPSEDGGTLMAVRSNNGGQVLKTLNILDAIRSGKLYMVTEFDAEDTSIFETNIELEDFSVIEAPTAVRMMSVLSLAGMYSLVEGDGTHFNLGHARLKGKDGRVVIEQARASGDALAVDLVGYVEPESRNLEVSGMLLPLYGITKLIGKVPLVGQILTGVDNAGFFATQFTLSGTIDEPETAINVSSIIPGVFRDVFSPDWINRERERLIPDEAAEAAKIIIDRQGLNADNKSAISQ